MFSDNILALLLSWLLCDHCLTLSQLSIDIYMYACECSFVVYNTYHSAIIFVEAADHLSKQAEFYKPATLYLLRVTTSRHSLFLCEHPDFIWYCFLSMKDSLSSFLSVSLPVMNAFSFWHFSVFMSLKVTWYHIQFWNILLLGAESCGVHLLLVQICSLFPHSLIGRS